MACFIRSVPLDVLVDGERVASTKASKQTAPLGKPNRPQAKPD
jgi:hypothetical protein